MLDQKVVASLLQPLKDEIRNPAPSEQERPDPQYHYDPFGWAKLADKEKLPIRA